MKKVIAVNTMSQLVGRGVSAVATFIITLIVARQLGANGYGDVVKITTYVAFFYLIADFGINAVYLQQSDDHAGYSALFVVRTIGSMVLIFCSLLVLYFLPGTSSQGYTPIVKLGVLLYSPTILLQAWITTANAVFQKRLRYDFASWAIIFGSIMSVGLIFVFVYPFHTMTIFSVIGALLAGTVVTSLTSLGYAFAHERPMFRQISFKHIAGLVAPAVPLGITLLFNLVYFRADSIVITLTRPTAEVGIYGFAYKVFEVALVFPTFFMNAVYPLMLKHRKYEFKKIFTYSFLFLLFMSIASMILVWFVAPFATFIRSDFVLSAGALRVLALGFPFFFVTSATMWALIALKKQAALSLIYGFSMLVNVLGNIVLVPTYGFMAAAWMTVAGEGLVLVLSGFVLLHTMAEKGNGNTQ